MLTVLKVIKRESKIVASNRTISDVLPEQLMREETDLSSSLLSESVTNEQKNMEIVVFCDLTAIDNMKESIAF